MLPVTLAFSALKAANGLIHSLQRPQARPHTFTPPRPSKLPQRHTPSLKNAPSFAEVFRQTGYPSRANPIAQTVAERLIRSTHQGMRTDRLQQFTGLTRQTLQNLSHGIPLNSPRHQQFRNMLKSDLRLNDAQVDSVMGQLSDLIHASPEVQDNFLRTRGQTLVAGF